ncbi:MAG: DNA repair protein RecN [Desulfobulbaceae bacterium]|nr:MAG: DNA repair protein RecN [Desulfobulbaceae bacterium]
MLKELWINNLALIEKLRLAPGPGLMVLTGETGAGKSIILQAIHLLAGGRASVDWVRSGTRQATVEALFEYAADHRELLKLLAAAGIDLDLENEEKEKLPERPPGELIVRRIINAKGKSRFYLNGFMATAATVGGIVELLLSVASQRDHQQLLQTRYHLECIDAAGNLWQQRRDFAILYDRLREVENRLAQWRSREQDKEQRRDFLSFQCREIADISPEVGEDERLVAERDRLKSADNLIELGRHSYAALADKINSPLVKVRKDLAEMAARDAQDQTIAKLAEDVAGASFILEEAQLTISRYLGTLTNDPVQLDRVSARIDLLQRLKRKYGPTLDDVLIFARKAGRELENLENMELTIAELAQEVVQQEQAVWAAATALSAARGQVAADFARRVGAELESLALNQARFAVSLPAGESSNLTRLGWDRPEFVFSANPGEPLKPLAKIASGGELSRLMLALKCVLARQDRVESVIFDEVDAGISGQAAESVARKIKELARHHQVICITHLPQIAAGADDHCVVSKREHDQRTITEVIELEQKERPAELARMLAGDTVTAKTLAYAAELISRSR